MVNDWFALCIQHYFDKLSPNKVFYRAKSATLRTWWAAETVANLFCRIPSGTKHRTKDVDFNSSPRCERSKSANTPEDEHNRECEIEDVLYQTNTRIKQPLERSQSDHHSQSGRDTADSCTRNLEEERSSYVHTDSENGSYAENKSGVIYSILDPPSREKEESEIFYEMCMRRMEQPREYDGSITDSVFHHRRSLISGVFRQTPIYEQLPRVYHCEYNAECDR